MPAKLTEGLGETWETALICFKSYPCHITAHSPIEALNGLRAEHGFLGRDVASMIIEASEKVLSHHDIPEPEDIAMAQYSVPYAASLYAFSRCRRPPLIPRGEPGRRRHRSALAQNQALALRAGNQAGQRLGESDDGAAQGQTRGLPGDRRLQGFSEMDRLLDELEGLKSRKDVSGLFA